MERADILLGVHIFIPHGQRVPIDPFTTESFHMIRSALILPGVLLALTCGAYAQANTGTTFCAAVPNSTGQRTALTGRFGTGVGSFLHLEARKGVPHEFGYFLAGNEATSGVVIGSGLLCLVGTPTSSVYRYNLAGTPSNSIGAFNSAGILQNLAGTSQSGSGFDVPSTIPGGVPIMIMSGDTWHFQVWHRDTVAMVSTSNLSNGLSVTFGLPQPLAGMVAIPAGSFSMGSDAATGSPYWGTTETEPVHDVTISQGFWMGEYEVTQDEYETLMGSNPSAFPAPTLPVEHVTWIDARDYCAALTAQQTALGNVPTGYEYRLPTEAEWEYSCRAGTTTEFSMGPDLFCGEANIDFSFHTNGSCGSAGTSPVGLYSANAWGLYDMHGNVYEWCLDAYSAYTANTVVDPFIVAGSGRVLRSGSWTVDSRFARSAFRISIPETAFGNSIGFRVVLGEVLVP